MALLKAFPDGWICGPLVIDSGRPLIDGRSGNEPMKSILSRRWDMLHAINAMQEGAWLAPRGGTVVRSLPMRTVLLL
jgi:hypothetical protein